jgi:hypothetical protein
MTQMQRLQTTKISTAKDRLNGGGKLMKAIGVKNLFEVNRGTVEMIAEHFHNKIIEELEKNDIPYEV